MTTNEQLFSASRSAPGNFTLLDLAAIRRDLLRAIADWFHQIHKATFDDLPEWLRVFRDDILKPRDTLISFNWDLILDQLIFGDKISAKSYGFGIPLVRLPKLLKPHGSLNWYRENRGAHQRGLAVRTPRGQVERERVRLQAL